MTILGPAVAIFVSFFLVFLERAKNAARAT